MLPERKPLVRHAWTVTKTADGVRVKPAASSIPPSALSFLACARAQRRAVETRTSTKCKCMQHSSGALANDAVEVTSSEASDLMMQPQSRYISDQECLLHSAEQGPLGDDSHYYLPPPASCTPDTKCGATDRLLATNNKYRADPVFRVPSYWRSRLASMPKAVAVALSVTTRHATADRESTCVVRRHQTSRTGDTPISAAALVATWQG